jgi:hypothetical protein
MEGQDVLMIATLLMLFCNVWVLGTMSRGPRLPRFLWRGGWDYRSVGELANLLEMLQQELHRRDSRNFR